MTHGEFPPDLVLPRPPLGPGGPRKWARFPEITLMYDRPHQRVEKGRISLKFALGSRNGPRGGQHGARQAGGVILDEKVATPARADAHV